MAERKGFTRVDLVVVVAVLGIGAGVVIPMLQRAFIAANEAATIGDIHTVIDAQTSYRSANAGFYEGWLPCLNHPSSPNCIPSYPPNGPTFLDPKLASLVAKEGYNRLFAPGPLAGNIPPNASPNSVNYYRYDATPTVIGVTGVRGFAGDQTGRICSSPTGPVPPGPNGWWTLPVNCTVVP